MRTPLVLLALAVLPLSACGSGDDPTVALEPPSGSPSQAAPAAPAPTGDPETGASRLLLRGDGLDVRAGGPVLALRFGESTLAEVEPALTRALGVQVVEQTVECGQGPRTAIGANGFDALLADGVLVGWDESGGQDRALVTDSGIRLGSTRAEVEAALPQAEFTEDTVGPEFSSPSGLGGFLDGLQPTSTVVGLTGGETCIAR